MKTWLLNYGELICIWIPRCKLYILISLLYIQRQWVVLVLVEDNPLQSHSQDRKIKGHKTIFCHLLLSESGCISAGISQNAPGWEDEASRRAAVRCSHEVYDVPADAHRYSSLWRLHQWSCNLEHHSETIGNVCVHWEEKRGALKYQPLYSSLGNVLI